MNVVYCWASDGAPRNAGIVIAVDILRASTTLVSALESGARRVLVTGSIELARHLAVQEGAELIGESKAKRIPGFRFGNSPAEIIQHLVPESLVFTSSNFPMGLESVGREVEVVIGALRNMSAVIRYCLRIQEARGGPIVIVLAGDAGAPCDEDLAFLLGVARRAVGRSWDSEQLSQVREQYKWRRLDSLVRQSAHGQHLRAEGFARDVELASQVDVSDVVPKGYKLHGRSEAFLFQLHPGCQSL